MQLPVAPSSNSHVDVYMLRRLLATAREAAPGIHVHAFSPLEVAQGAATSGWSLDT